MREACPAKNSFLKGFQQIHGSYPIIFDKIKTFIVLHILSFVLL